MKTIFFVLCLVLVSFSAFSQKKTQAESLPGPEDFFQSRNRELCGGSPAVCGLYPEFQILS
jgi:hypothetical protein